MQDTSSALTRALRLTVVVLGVGLVVTAGTARAADDESEKSFSDRFIDGFKTTINGGTSIDDGRIEYRERSPLVVPPKLDLPQPDASSNQVKAANWPKDPDEGRRRASAAKKKSKPGILDALNPFKPATPASEVDTASVEPPSLPPPPRPDNPNAKNDPIYDRAGDILSNNVITSQLGFGGFNLFGNKAQSAQFTGEPTRESLTQPPVGYQTPSSSFAYGTGPKDWLKSEPSPDDTARAVRTQQ